MLRYLVLACVLFASLAAVTEAAAQSCPDCSSCCCPAGQGGGCTGGAKGPSPMLECPASWDCCGGSNSPIIVDTTGLGFRLTSAEDGVWFDIHADGHPILISWTAAGSGNAFLALDRNHNGRIDN